MFLLAALTLASLLAPVGAFFAAHPVEGLLLAYLALNLLNGLLPASAARGPLGRVLHAVMDRLAVLTRSDAVGTLKWPVIGRSLLGIAVEAVVQHPEDVARLADVPAVDLRELAASDVRITRLEVPAPVAPAPHGSRAGEPPRDPSDAPA